MSLSARSARRAKKELQAAVRVFLCDRDNESQIRFHHFLFRPPGLGLTDRHLPVDLFDLGDVEICKRLDSCQLALCS